MTLARIASPSVLAAASGLPRGMYLDPATPPPAGAPAGTPPATPPAGAPPATPPATPPAGTPPGAPPASAEVDRIRGERDQLAIRLLDLEKKINDAPAVTPKDLADLKKFRDEQASLEAERKKKEGQFELLIKEQADAHKAALAAAEARVAEANAKLASSLKLTTLSSIIPKYTGVKPVSDVIAAVFDRSVSFKPDGSYEIKDEKGEHPIDPATGRKMELEVFVARECNARDWCRSVKPAIGSGGASQGGGGSGVAGQFTPEDIAAMTPAQFKANREAILKQANSR